MDSKLEQLELAQAELDVCNISIYHLESEADTLTDDLDMIHFELEQQDSLRGELQVKIADLERVINMYKRIALQECEE